MIYKNIRFSKFSLAMAGAGFITVLTLKASMMSASAVSLAVSWDPSTSSNIANYSVYCGSASGVYTTNVAVGTKTNATLTGLAEGSTWYVAVKAKNAQGLESDFSAEVKYTIPVASVPPTIALASPANGASYTSPASIALSANVAANNHTINKVQFFNGTNLLAERTVAPYSYTWTNTVPNTYSVTARLVYDTTASLTTSPAKITVTGLASPWKTADIGTVYLPGSASSSGGTYSLKGSGKISGTADSFRLVYQPISGNGEIRAQIRSIQNSTTGGDNGVMIRESLTAGSRYVMAGITAGGTYQWQARKATSSSTTVSNSVAGNITNAWVRIVRNGNTNTCYRSADGATWTQMGNPTVTMATNIYFGLVVAPGQTNITSSCTMSNVIAIP